MTVHERSTSSTSWSRPRASGPSCAVSSAGSTPSSSSSRRWSSSTRSARSPSAVVQAFTWLVVLFVTFFVPSALASAELGAALPGGGRCLRLGPRRRSAVRRRAHARCSTGPGRPMWLGGSVAVVAMTVYQRFIGELSMTGAVRVRHRLRRAGDARAAVVPLRYGKWVPTSGRHRADRPAHLLHPSVVLVRRSATACTGSASATSRPRPACSSRWCRCCIYSFVGVELPSTAAEEMVDPRRDMPVAIARAGVGAGADVRHPDPRRPRRAARRSITSLHGLIDAMKTVFTVYGGSVDSHGGATLTGAGQVLGWICAVTFIWVLLASGSAWIMGAGRAQAAACLDGGGPRVLGRISSRTGVPVRDGARLRRRRAGRAAGQPLRDRRATIRSTSPPR